MRFTFFHRGLHAWAIYIVVGLSQAYFSYRHNLPLSVRSTLYPVLGQRIHGRIGDAVDIFAVFGTMFGVATSLGFGVLQANAGIASLGLLPQSTAVQVVLIAAISATACLSVAVGLDKGILRLSVINLSLALVVMLFVLITGPTLSVLSGFVQQLGDYTQFLPETTLWTDTPAQTGWQIDWTIFYWGWWISWSPFVGMFIARVSRGRTVREFVFGVLLVPTLLTFLWLAVFGNTAFSVDSATDGALGGQAVGNPSIALFGLLGELPFTTVVTVLAILLVALYFITSSGSAGLVIDLLTSGGATDTPRIQRAFRPALEGAIAAMLLLAGGLAALRTVAISTALPFSLVTIMMCYGLARALYADDHKYPLDQVVLTERGHKPVPEYEASERGTFANWWRDPP